MVRVYKIVVYLVILLSVLSCKDKEEFLIKGEILNLKTPYVLASYFSADTLALDTVYVDSKGKFKYVNTIDTLTSFSLYLNDYENATVVFANKGETLKLKGDALLPELIEVEGNEINNDLTLFKTRNRELLAQRGRLMLNLTMVPVSDTIDIESITRRDESAKLQMLNHELSLQAEEFVKNNPTKFSSLILINNFFMNSDNPQALERVLGYMKGDVLRSEFGIRLKAFSEKINRSAEGARMPYFSLKDKDGEEIRSNMFLGKHLLLSFVSTGGIESRDALDFLKSAYKEVGSDSVKFLTVYIDSDIYPIEYVENDSIPWTVVPEKRSWSADIVDAYNVQYVPFNILIGPDGNIKMRNIPAQEVAKAIKNSSEKK